MKSKGLLVILVAGFIGFSFLSYGQDNDQLLERMALNGDVKAQFIMGLRCTNSVQSYAWLNVAANQEGDLQAEIFKFRSEVRKEMSSAEADAGQALSRTLEDKIRQNQESVLRKAAQDNLTDIRAGDVYWAPYVQKALSGDAKAQCEVGRHSFHEYAYAWYSLAADQGEKSAIEYHLPIARNYLSPEKLEKARELVQKIKQEIERNQLLSKEDVDQALEQAKEKYVEREREAARVLAEQAKQVARQAAIERAEQAKEAERALAERNRAIAEQERITALQRAEQERLAILQRERAGAIQQQEEKAAAQRRFIITLFASCGVLCAIYFGRMYVKRIFAQLASGKTNTYHIYQHPISGYEAVKVGFSWPAFFFGIFWMLFKKLWIPAALWFSFGIAVGAIREIAIVLESELLAMLYFVLLGGDLVVIFIVAFKGNEWRRKNLVKRGFELMQKLEAETPEAAIAFVAKQGATRPKAE